MDEPIKYFVTVFFILYMFMSFVLPSVRTFKRTGINPITFGKTDNAHNYIGKLFKILLALVPITIAVYWTGDARYKYLLPVSYLEKGSVQWLGLLFCSASFIWTIVAQWQMGNSWRIGIDEQHRTQLVTSGVFSVSRNPIFLGMQVSLLGLFLLLPNAVTFLVLTAGCMLIQIQTRLEEEFLIKQYGAEYKQYKGAVPRYI